MDKQSTTALKAPQLLASSVRRVRIWVVAVSFIMGLSGGAALMWLLSTTKVSPTRSAGLLDEVTQLSERLAAEQAENDSLRGQLVIEQSTIKGLELSLQQGEEKLGRLQEQLAFFDKLLPPGPQGSISIRAFDAEVVGHLLRYRLLLQRNAASGKVFEGTFRFTAEGLQEGKRVSLNLQAATRAPEEINGSSTATLEVDRSTVAGNSNFELSFEQFNRSGGWLAIPENFIPQSLSVYIQEGNTLRASRKIEITTP